MLLNSENTVTLNFKEESFNDVIDDVTEKFQFVGFVCGFFYVCAIFIIQYWMKTRSKFELKNFAVIWNASMLVLNTAATIGLLPTLAYVLINENFYVSICTDKTCNNSTFCGFWLRMFPYLKIIELGDTILLVLQKRKLVAYYWCHHLGALLITWYIYPSYPPSIILWLAVMINLSHIFIYLYGTTRSLGFSVPQNVPAALLLSEILQMLIGATLCSFIYYYAIVGDYCDITILNASVLFSMYLLCFVLCSVLYYKRFYIRNKTIESKSVLTLTSIITEK
ncbi:very long chain fatty acid elongase 6-like [Planococcus citri]|uniref:very long chain fatty acid elongase 6-like n=1 Tax=Planococcus citri TaxID=170843 RepID=UPI0031F8885A